MNDINDPAGRGRAPATSVEALDVHLSYMQASIDALGRALKEGLEDMATKADIDRIEKQMGGFVTRAELERVEQSLRQDSISSTFDRWANIVTKLGAVVGVLAGAAAAIVALVHFLDRMPKP